MIREVISTTKSKLVIDIPRHYLNKELEVIVFPLPQKKLAHVGGKVIKRTHVGNRRLPGALKGKIWMSEDFNAPLDEFKEYME